MLLVSESTDHSRASPGYLGPTWVFFSTQDLDRSRKSESEFCSVGFGDGLCGSFSKIFSSSPHDHYASHGLIDRRSYRLLSDKRGTLRCSVSVNRVCLFVSLNHVRWKIVSRWLPTRQKSRQPLIRSAIDDTDDKRTRSRTRGRVNLRWTS